MGIIYFQLKDYYFSENTFYIYPITEKANKLFILLLFVFPIQMVLNQLSKINKYKFLKKYSVSLNYYYFAFCIFIIVFSIYDGESFLNSLKFLFLSNSATITH